MPCSCEGYPPSPTDLVTRAKEAVEKIEWLTKELNECHKREKELTEELDTLKKAFQLMGNGG